MTKVLLLIAGGAIGTLARFGISGLTQKYFDGGFPWGTLMVNLTGALIIGFIWGFWETGKVSVNLRTFVFIGILGGYTTFSSYAFETLNLFRDGETKLALINILASNILGILFFQVGVYYFNLRTK